MKDRLTYSRTEVAKSLGISERTVDRMIQRNVIKARRIGRRVLIPTDQVAKLLAVEA